MFRSALGSKIQLCLEDGSHGASIHVDPTLLTTAMLNLLSNAYDAMPNGGDDAANRLQKDPAFDFVLSDLHMPGTMDGADLAAWIANNLPKIGVVLMIGYHEVPEDRIRVPMLKKPFRLDELRELLYRFYCPSA